MRHVCFSKDACCIILDISRPAFDQPTFNTMDFLQSPKDNMRCSHCFIFLAWCILAPIIATSFCRDILTLPGYCHDLPPWIREMKALLGHETGSKTTMLRQTSSQTFMLEEASTNIRKHQFLQSLNSKCILLFSTILEVFGPLDPLTSIRRLPRQLKTEPNRSADHQMPADCKTCLSAALQLFHFVTAM